MSTTALSGSNIGGNGAKLGAVAEEIPRYGLAVVLAYLGLMKFTSYEANAIVGLVENSPLLSWTYSIFSARALSGLIGTVELGIASLLFIGGRFPKVRLVGSAAAVGTFALTLTFLLSTPGVFEPTLGGFPALSVMPGQFLIKDIALFAVGLGIFGRALREWQRGPVA